MVTLKYSVSALVNKEAGSVAVRRFPVSNKVTRPIGAPPGVFVTPTVVPWTKLLPLTCTITCGLFCTTVVPEQVVPVWTQIDLMKGAGKLMVCEPQEGKTTITIIKNQKAKLKFPRKIPHPCLWPTTALLAQS